MLKQSRFPMPNDPKVPLPKIVEIYPDQLLVSVTLTATDIPDHEELGLTGFTRGHYNALVTVDISDPEHYKVTDVCGQHVDHQVGEGHFTNQNWSQVLRAQFEAAAMRLVSPDVSS